MAKNKPAKTAKPRASRKRIDRWWKRYLRRLAVVMVLLLVIVSVLLVAVQLVLWSGLPRDIAVSTIRAQTGLDTSVGAVEISLLGDVKVREVELTLPETAVPVQAGAPRPADITPEPFARVEEISAKLPPLPLVAVQFLAGKPNVNLVDIEGITVDARQYDDGTWNLQRIAEQVQRTLAKPTAQPESQGLALPLSLPLPKVDLRDITLRAMDNKGRRQTIAPISVFAESDKPLHWTFKVSLPETTGMDGAPLPRSITGELVPAGRFDHVVYVELPNAAALIDPIIPLPGTGVQLNWVGNLADGIDGQLRLEKIAIDIQNGVTIRGDVLAKAGSRGGPLFQADVVEIVIDNVPQVGTVIITSGTLNFDGKTARLTDGRAELLGGTAAIREAAIDVANLVGNADLKLTELTYAGNTVSGNANLDVRRSNTDGLSIELTGDFGGNSVAGPFAARVDVNGSGESFRELDWRASVDEAHVVRGGQRIDLPILVANASTAFLDELTQVLLKEVRTDDVDLLRAEGGLTLSADERIWWFYGEIADLALTLPRLPESNNQVTLAGLVNVWGELPRDQSNGLTVIIDQLYGTGGGLVVSGSGKFTPGGAADAELTDTATGDLAENLASVLPLQLALTVSDNGEVGASSTIVDGNIRGNFNLAGDPDPERWFIEFDGKLDAMNLAVASQAIDDIGGDITGSLNAKRIVVQTQNVRGLGGTAALDVMAPLDATEPIRGTLAVRDIELAQVGRIANLPPLSGRLANADLALAAETLTADALRVDGSFAVLPEGTDPKIIAGPLVVGESITGDIRLRGFDLSATNITVTSTRELGGQPRRGNVIANAFVSLNDLQRITANVDVDDYYIDLPALSDALDVVVNDFDANELVITFEPDKLLPSVDGMINLDADVTIAQVTDMVEISVAAEARDRAFNINDLRIAMATAGELTGEARFPFDEPAASTFRLIGDDLDLSPLLTDFAGETALDQVSGIWDIDVNLRPADVKRPLAPLQLDIDVDVEDGQFMGMSIGGLDVRAFADLAFTDEAGRSAFQFNKFVTRYAIARFAEGTVDTFARVTRKMVTDSDGSEQLVLQSLVTIDIGSDSQTPDAAAPLDLKQLVGLVNPDGIGAAGLVNGKMNFGGDLLDITRAVDEVNRRRAAELAGTPVDDASMASAIDVFGGSGRLNLTELGIYGPKARTIGFDARDDSRGNGEGTIGFDFFRGNIRAKDINIRVTPIQVRGALSIDNVLFTDDPPIDGYIVALASPLGDIDLPFVNNADQLLTAIQSAANLQSFRIQGTVSNFEPVPAAFAEIGDQTKKLLVGDARDSR
ncbi:MAG: hypothetical protein AAGD32_10750 [Planctomycetota bacterium]